MFHLHDTNVVSRLTEKRLSIDGWKNGTQAIAPVVIFELMANVNEKYLDQRKATIRFILDNDYVILGSTSTHLQYSIGLDVQAQLGREQSAIVKLCEDFLDKGVAVFGTESPFSVDDMKRSAEGNFAKSYHDLREKFVGLETSSNEKLDLEALAKRVWPKWKAILQGMEMVRRDHPILFTENRVDLDLVSNLVVALQTYIDVQTEYSLKELRRTADVDQNDFTDISQFMYLQPGNLFLPATRSGSPSPKEVVTAIESELFNVKSVEFQ
jgi:hypothetical protein